MLNGDAWRNADMIERADPRVRGYLSGPAIRAFLALAARWDLSTAETQALLGWVSESTVQEYTGGGKIGTLTYDTLTRISLCLGIHKALQTLFAEREFADRWVRLPNSNVLFGGQAPLTTMVRGGIDALYQVRRLLESRVH